MTREPIAVVDPQAGSMAGKTVLVTGSTSGIGRATVQGLAAMGARVGIIGRDRARATRAARAIGAASSARVDVFVADLSSQAEIRRLAGEVLQTYPRLDVLVNNVGGYWNTRHVTADGLEHTFALDHLAPFLLASLLLDRLRRSSPARVVTVASQAHVQGRIDFEDLQAEHSYSGSRAHNQAKLANLLSPTSWPASSGRTASPRTPSTPAWSAPPSAQRTPAAPSEPWFRSCGCS